MKAMFAIFRIEFREACQRLLSRPGYTALSVAVLAVGLGATLFVLGAINTLVLQPGPFSSGEAVYQLGELEPDDTEKLDELAAGDALNLLRNESAVTAFAMYQQATINIADQKTVARYDGVLVNSGVFTLLGVPAFLGRTLQPEDDRPGAPRVAVISHRIWQDRFGGSAEIIGRRVRINAQDASIVGVMPEGFSYPFSEQVWFAAQFDPNAPREEQPSTIVLVRLAEGTDLLAVRERLNVLWSEIQKDVRSDTRVPNPVEFLQVSYVFTPRHTRMILNLMLVTGFGVLLLACANVAGLLAAQVVARARELAVRAAIGACRGRILFGILCESFILASIAAAIGLVIAHFGGKGVESVFAAAGEAPPYWMHFGIDWRLALMGFGSALLATALAGIAPAWRASGGDVQALRDGAKGSSAGTSRMGRILIVLQVALSCLLLVGAGSVYRDLDRLATMDLGIKVDPSEILTGRVAIFPQAFPTPADQVQFFERLGDTLRADPEVAHASVSQALPGGIGSGTDYRLDGDDPKGDAHYAHFSAVDDHFLLTYGIPLKSGRSFQSTDTMDGVRVAVVDQAFVDRHWPGQDAIGRRLHPADGNPQPVEIVGVVPTLHLTEIDDSANPTVLMSLRQAPSRFNSLSIRARGGDLASLSRRLPSMVRAVDADTPVYWVRRLDETIATGMVGQQVLAVIFGLFGAVGLLLAAAGIYGLLSQTVANRTREIGVRRAIGASGARVMQQVSAGSLTRVGIGLVIGLGLGVPWSRLMSIDDASTWTLDPWLFLIVLVAILLSAGLAIWVPARRALAVDPITALRHD